MCENKIIPRLTEIDIHSIFLISFFFIFLGANVSYGKEYMVKLKSVGIGFNGDIIRCGSKDGKSYVEIKKGKGPGGPVDDRTITKIEGDKQIIIYINNLDNTGTEMENPDPTRSTILSTRYAAVESSQGDRTAQIRSIR